MAKVEAHHTLSTDVDRLAGKRYEHLCFRQMLAKMRRTLVCRGNSWHIPLGAGRSASLVVGGRK